MASAAKLIEQAMTVVPPGTAVIAAGVFAVQDDYIANALGAFGGSAVAREIVDNAAAEGIGAAAGVRAAREAHAGGLGVSLRMLVVVTSDQVTLFRLPATGETPGEKLMTFNRASSNIDVEHFGASVHLDLAEGDKEMKLTGGVGLLASYKEGNKKVVQELTS